MFSGEYHCPHVSIHLITVVLYYVYTVYQKTGPFVISSLLNCDKDELHRK